MRRRRRKKSGYSSSNNVWRSYSDMMSGLLLLFILIMAVSLMQAQKNYTEKLAEQAARIKTMNELQQSQSMVDKQAEQLEQQQSELNDKQGQLDEQQSQIDEQQMTLEQQAIALNELMKDLEEGKLILDNKESELAEKDQQLQTRESELADSQAQLDESRTMLNTANQRMAEQQQRIDQIIGVKAELIQALNDEFQRNQIQVDIDKQTGAILLDSNVLFAFGESELTAEGLTILDQVLPVYCRVLLGGEYVNYVAEVIIDGYADSTGDYISNLYLSQARAGAVAQYLLLTEQSFLTEEQSELLRSKLSANGKSTSKLVMDDFGNEDMDASRRVEIKFRLTDEEMMEELSQLVSDGRAAAEEALGQ